MKSLYIKGCGHLFHIHKISIFYMHIFMESNIDPMGLKIIVRVSNDAELFKSSFLTP